MANQQNLSRRAALRQQQEMEERQQRNKRVLTIGVGILVVAIIAVVAIVTIPSLLGANKVEVTANQQTPPNATAEYGVLLDGKQPEEGKPHVVVYSDFRCPACKSREETYGPALKQLADEGKITIEYRSTYFLDGESGGDNSERAAIAADAADAVGKYYEYKQVLYANQATRYSDKELREEFAQQAGIEGADLEKFQELFRTRAFKDFAEKANQQFIDNGIGSTPTFVVGDQRIVFADQETREVFIQPTPDSLMAAFQAAYDGTDAKTHQPL